MSENKRYTVKSQDNFFAVVDNYSEDKRCIINGIRTEIEAEWLCDEMNELNDEKEWLEMNNKDLVSFIKSKGYNLKDFIKYVGQFSSVGVNKEDWND